VSRRLFPNGYQNGKEGTLFRDKLDQQRGRMQISIKLLISLLLQEMEHFRGYLWAIIGNSKKT
jgi:hypothetical protein